MWYRHSVINADKLRHSNPDLDKYLYNKISVDNKEWICKTCRLLAPRIAFQKLMQAPRGRQLKIHGDIVNVPADITHTVSMLPRLQSEASTIKII